MKHSATYLDDYADDFYYGYDDAGSLTAHDDEADAFGGYTSFFDLVEAHAVYAGVAERAYDAARKAEERETNHAYRYDDNRRRREAHKAERQADPDAVREATRKRVAAHRARKRAERLAQKG